MRGEPPCLSTPSAISGDLFGDDQVIGVWAGEGGTDPILQFGGRQQPGGLGDAPFAVQILVLQDGRFLIDETLDVVAA